MKLGGHKPGSLTLFIDAATEEALLEVAADDEGRPLVGYRLYDSIGNLVSVSKGRQSFPKGLRIVGVEDELLLLLPDSSEGNIEYRLYSSRGNLLAASDGNRTQIFGNLRLEGPSKGRS
jgi:hypothetical protein